MRQLRATLRAQRQGATINPEELSQIKLVGVKPKVRCSECGQTIKTNLAEKKVAKEQLEKTQE